MSDSRKKRPEWEEYSVGEPGDFSTTCRSFETVYHIAHVSDAFRIFEDRRLRATLVRDESKLKETRSSVTWLSPNTWANGSFYGNVRFEFDWKKLVQDKRFYWVEVMDYSPKAFRILVTNEKPSLDLELYRPEKDDGPLYHDTDEDKWYWNGEMTGEFMLDGDLPLSECKTVSFDSHHHRTCKKDGPSCADMNRERYGAGAALLSRLIAQNVIYANGRLRRLFLNEEEAALHFDAEASWGNILRAFNKIKTKGKLTHTDESAPPLLAAMLDMYGAGRDIKKIGSLFYSTDELELALRRLVAKALDMPLKNVTDSEA
jgi:hypothetical protein